MRTCGTTSLGSFFAIFALTIMLAGHEARAAWPPAPNATSADVADPQNWPNDPAYGYSPNSSGQWTHYGFLPPATDGAIRRPGETTAGMSVDLAWRISTGAPRVILAVTDTGVLWDEPDLVDKIFINHHELNSYKPLHADQSACGGSGELAGFDCNGDGVFTVGDYAELLSVPKDDRNANGVIDAGDLIAAFSDGIDDDGNGYADDIAGWDFMKDDNNPFDDTRDGHGTQEALIAAASTNNGFGGAGVCPGCRVLPLRVGDSAAADAQDFGQAVVYAADLGAKVVASALATPNMTRFASQAIDYANSKSVLVVTATSVGASRRHDMPATSNHTLVAHAIGFDGKTMTSSSSYLAAQTCSHYGAQDVLSASSETCGTGVAGALAGIAGLMTSTALEYGTTPPLTAGEMRALLTSTADDVDIPESHLPGSPYQRSQTGFDEHFGYGRINANRVVEAIANKRIPPEATITSPAWFGILYADLVGSPIEIRGSIAAPRANAFDYAVEWARGVEPLEADFAGHVIAKQDNVDPTMTIGASESLALLDVRNVNALLEGEAPHLHAPNDHAITVRIRAVAHYGGDVGDVSSETRRTYFVHTDPDLAVGFPLAVGDSIESGPKIADIDGDGKRDLVVLTSGGLVHAFALTKVGPVPLAGFPFQTNVIDGLESPPQTGLPSYRNAPAYASGAVDMSLAREGFVNAPAIADLDGDGTVEIVATSFAGTIYVIEPDGSLRASFPPKTLPRIDSCNATDPSSPCMDETNLLARGAFASPVLVDLDADGKLDIVQAAFDGKVYAFTHDGQPVNGFPVDVHFPDAASRARIATTPATADLNDDGFVDLVIGSNEQVGPDAQFGAVYVIDGRGMNAPDGPILSGWPVSTRSPRVTPLIGEGVSASPAIASFQGELAAVVQGNGSSPLVLPAQPGAQTSFGELPEFALPKRMDETNGLPLRGLEPADKFGAFSNVSQPNEMLSLLSSPSVGDIDQDGVPDVISAGGSASLLARLRGEQAPPSAHMLAVWSGATGAMLYGSPMPLEDFGSSQDHAIADLNGDDYPEIIGGTSGYFLHAYDGCGREPEGFPKFTGQWIVGAPAIGDLDGDGSLELAAGTRSGLLYVWRTQGTTSGVVAWESAHHDNRNTGNLEVPLAQGVLLHASSRLTSEACTPPAPQPPLGVGGGCGCRTSKDEPDSPLFLFVAAASLALARRRVARE